MYPPEIMIGTLYKINSLENLSNYVVIKSGETITSYNQLKSFTTGRYVCHFNLQKFKLNHTLLKVYRVNGNLSSSSDIFLRVQHGTKEYSAFINSNGNINEFPVVP